MSDQSIAAIARNLAAALLARAHSRSAEDQKAVLQLQTELVAETVVEEIHAEKISTSESRLGLGNDQNLRAD